jgi:hypothetical protein
MDPNPKCEAANAAGGRLDKSRHMLDKPLPLRRVEDMAKQNKGARGGDTGGRGGDTGGRGGDTGGRGGDTGGRGGDTGGKTSAKARGGDTGGRGGDTGGKG